MEATVCCVDCGRNLGAIDADSIGEHNLSPLLPCSNCEGRKLHFFVTFTESFQMIDQVRGKARGQATKRPLVEIKVGYERYSKTGEIRSVHRKIDRTNISHDEPWYDETIRDSEGKVVREVSQPLSKHTGRGAAKKNIT